MSLTDIAGVVLAGVHRWGESAFEQLLPRPLLPVAESPLLCYGLRWLRDAGIRRTTICANSESRLVRRCLGDGLAVGLDLHYYEDMTPRGPAGCARDASLTCAARDFVVVEGCVIPSVDLSKLLRVHRRTGAAVTVVVQGGQWNGVWDDGMARPVGVYVFSRRALDLVPATGYQDIKELLIPQLHDQGERVSTYVAERACPRITDADSYLAANEWMIGEIVAGGLSLCGYRRVGEVCMHEQAQVADSVRLVGQVLIGPGSRLAEEATIVGPTTIGAECVIERRAVVSRSVLWDRCCVGRAAIVDQCILPTNASVAAEARVDGVLHACGAPPPVAGGVSETGGG